MATLARMGGTSYFAEGLTIIVWLKNRAQDFDVVRVRLVFAAQHMHGARHRPCEEEKGFVA